MDFSRGLDLGANPPSAALPGGFFVLFISWKIPLKGNSKLELHFQCPSYKGKGADVFPSFWELTLLKSQQTLVEIQEFCDSQRCCTIKIHFLLGYNWSKHRNKTRGCFYFLWVSMNETQLGSFGWENFFQLRWKVQLELPDWFRFFLSLPGTCQGKHHRRGEVVL